MIHYIVTEEHSYTIGAFLASWAGPVASRIRVVSYDDLLSGAVCPPGAYIFSDVERLNEAGTVEAETMWDTFTRAGFHVLNHPRRTMRRYDLLRTLFDRGKNDFAIYRLSETMLPRRFPVYLRVEYEHQALSDLLRTPEELDAAVAGALRMGHGHSHLLMIEYCDTSDEMGVFRKYGAFVIGDRIVPRHIYFGKEWNVQHPQFADDSTRTEEREYLTTNPHQLWLRSVFQLAEVSYGRVDYSYLHGRPQVWEINTNPVIMLSPDVYNPAALDLKTFVAGEIARAFEAIDSACDHSPDS